MCSFSTLFVLKKLKTTTGLLDKNFYVIKMEEIGADKCNFIIHKMSRRYT